MKFSNFQEEADEEIKKFMKEQIEKVEGMWNNVEEHFVYVGGNTGVVRFKTETDMWNCIDKIKWSYEHKDGRIYVDTNYEWRSEEEIARSKAVRKLRRTLYEQSCTREQMKSNYALGIVELNGKKIAEWDKQTKSLKFTAEGKQYEESFNKNLAQID